ncbi:MAG: hypothetical protein GMKNLPBB_01223 [Myxococcota bacterium]|nr:hypothetical protein [Myxococcota bacterium]
MESWRGDFPSAAAHGSIFLPIAPCLETGTTIRMECFPPGSSTPHILMGKVVSAGDDVHRGHGVSLMFQSPEAQQRTCQALLEVSGPGGLWGQRLITPGDAQPPQPRSSDGWNVWVEIDGQPLEMFRNMRNLASVPAAVAPWEQPPSGPALVQPQRVRASNPAASAAPPIPLASPRPSGFKGLAMAALAPPPAPVTDQAGPAEYVRPASGSVHTPPPGPAPAQPENQARMAEPPAIAPAAVLGDMADVTGVEPVPDASMVIPPIERPVEFGQVIAGQVAAAAAPIRSSPGLELDLPPGLRAGDALPPPGMSPESTISYFDRQKPFFTPEQVEPKIAAPAASPSEARVSPDQTRVAKPVGGSSPNGRGGWDAVMPGIANEKVGLPPRPVLPGYSRPKREGPGAASSAPNMEAIESRLRMQRDMSREWSPSVRESDLEPANNVKIIVTLILVGLVVVGSVVVLVRNSMLEEFAEKQRQRNIPDLPVNRTPQSTARKAAGKNQRNPQDQPAQGNQAGQQNGGPVLVQPGQIPPSSDPRINPNSTAAPSDSKEDLVKFYIEQGDKAMEARNYLVAKAHYQAAIQKDPGNPLATAKMVEAMRKMDEKPKVTTLEIMAPEGSMVYQGDNLIATGYARIENPRPGNHAFTITIPGRPTFTRVFLIKEGEANVMRFD